ncbi:hypothetical protein Acr_15g0019720 [Actinidia rufa]|uniref:Uncharacterized protein n=1 Tax=Actinidia rufa TaxID=165716 RepID=A0A7J0FXQ4_9ERIC|nr:hypothetical protein Acr_15g0019720 [Actinidia rufa]
MDGGGESGETKGEGDGGWSQYLWMTLFGVDIGSTSDCQYFMGHEAVGKLANGVLWANSRIRNNGIFGNRILFCSKMPDPLRNQILNPFGPNPVSEPKASNDAQQAHWKHLFSRPVLGLFQPSNSKNRLKGAMHELTQASLMFGNQGQPCKVKLYDQNRTFVGPKAQLNVKRIELGNSFSKTRKMPKSEPKPFLALSSP